MGRGKRQGLFSDADSDSSGASVRTSEKFEHRMSVQQQVDNKVESYLKIDISPAAGKVKFPSSAERIKTVSAPPAYKLHAANNPIRQIGAVSKLVLRSMEALYNIQDRPRDIHRTILLNM